MSNQPEPMDDEEDPFANMRPARSATRRKAVREPGTAPPTIVETEAFGSRPDVLGEAPSDDEGGGGRAELDALVRRGDNSASRLAMAAAMSAPSAPEALAPSGATVPLATMPESVSSFGSRAPIEAPDVGGKQRRASNDGATSAPARTQAQMPAMSGADRAADMDVEPPRLAPVVVNGSPVHRFTESERRRVSPRPAALTAPARGVPGWAWFGLGVFVGVCLTILLGLTLGLTLS